MSNIENHHTSCIYVPYVLYFYVKRAQPIQDVEGFPTDSVLRIVLVVAPGEKHVSGTDKAAEIINMPFNSISKELRKSDKKSVERNVTILIEITK